MNMILDVSSEEDVENVDLDEDADTNNVDVKFSMTGYCTTLAECNDLDDTNGGPTTFEANVTDAGLSFNTITEDVALTVTDNDPR